MPSEFAREPSRCEEDENDANVPKEVLEAIDNLAAGNTASKDEIEDVLKF